MSDLFDWRNTTQQTPSYLTQSGYGSGTPSFFASPVATQPEFMNFNPQSLNTNNSLDYGWGSTSLGNNTTSGVRFSGNTGIGGVGGGGALSSERSWWDSMAGGKNADGSTYNGWGGMAIAGLGTAVNLWSGLENLKLGKESLALQKQQYLSNYDSQRKMVNSQLEDRQKLRVLESKNAMPVSEYMAKYGIS